jgi:hypothetical protein
VVKTLARPLVLDQPGRRARSSASTNVVQSATRAACCRLPVDQAISPLLDQAATWRGNRSATAQDRAGRLCTAMVPPGSHRPAVRHGSAPLAVAARGPGRPIPEWPLCDLWQRVLH